MSISAPNSKHTAYSGPALRTFFNICHDWDLNNTETQTILGVTADSTFYKWKKYPDQANLSKDTLERISYVFGIYKALQILLPDRSIADQWIHFPNMHPLFNGKKPIERMLSGQIADLYEVRRHLDSQRGW